MIVYHEVLKENSTKGGALMFENIDSGLRLETNFVVKKFLELPSEEKLRLYHLMKAEDEMSMIEVGIFLLNLLVNNLKEMAKFAGPFDDWAVFSENAPFKAAFFWKYFKHNIVLVDDDVRVTPA